MTHKSRLAGFIIDCQTDDLEQASRFWSQALGLAITEPDDGSGRYACLQDGPGKMHIEVQKVEHASRVHLDIETDDIEAEVTRLIAIGAKEISRPYNRRWVVMEAPTGQRFCVVRMRDDQAPGIHQWQ